MVRRDLEYIAKRGVATDLKIVALTVVEMITGGVPARGISRDFSDGGVLAHA